MNKTMSAPLSARTPRQRSKTLQQREEPMTPRIVAFQNMGDFTHQVDSVVPVDEPLFQATPPEIRFSDFECLQSLDATLHLRNQDNVARRVKVLQPDSTFFKVLPGKGRKANGEGDNKVAPGMEVSYIVRFTPDQQVEDYSYDLVVVTERERFIVTIRATGGSAMLDMPTELDFGLSPVKYEALKTIMVRNVGEKPTKFLLKVPPPFSTSIQDGYLEVGETMQVDVVFRPDKAEPYERDMLVVYGDGLESHMALKGRAENVNVTFSANQLQMEDTFIALSTQKTIVIHNNSEIPVDFSWRAFPSIQEEIGQKLKLQVQLKQEEHEEAAALQELGDDSEEESLSESSDEYDARFSSLKGVELAQGALQRRYKNIAKAILEDPMFFYDEIFAVEPLSGRIWAKSKVAITFTFTPKAALNYQCLAYCSVVGRAERLPLLLKGTGIGPKAAFSYDELDVGDIFVESVHQYEVNLINQGDIDVEFRLVPNTSPFGSKFTFLPSDGRLEVGGQCTIVVEVCPDLLGEFQETFYWELVGSTSKIGLSFRGHSVSPTFHFDLDRISFGVVSYGFLNSKTLTLTNTSEVPMRFALRIPGDGRFTQREFDVIPPKGTLLPNCSQKVQIDFISMNVKSYDLCLVVDLDGVGQELASIPIQARCAVPQVTPEPAEHLEYGDIFIRYPSHQTLVLNNTSALPAKFQIMPQDEATRSIAEFEPDQSFGSVPPSSSHVLTFTLTSQVIGTLQIPITIRILGHNSASTVTLIANTIGPIVNVEPSVVDWGNAQCLEPITRSVLVSNNSVIPASIRCIMKTKNSLWTLSPKAMELPPHGSANLNMTLTIDEVAKMTDIVHVIVHESNDVAATVRAKGVGTPVMCRESLELIDFGTQYTTQTHSKEFIIENRGRQPRKLIWALESQDLKRKERKAPGKDAPEGDPFVFAVVPDTMTLDGKCAFRFVFNASSPKPGMLTDTLICTELCGNDRKGNVIFRSELRGNFVLPLLELSTTTVSFRYLWERNCPLHPLSEQLVLKNISPLEVRFFIKVQPPFYVNIDTCFLRPDETIEIRVEFDPAFKVDRVCGVVKQKLTIVYQDHPQRDHVSLHGEVIFPNLTLSNNKLDFGSVLNETTKQLTITMANPNPLPVNFQWSFVEEADMSDEEYNRATAGSGASPLAGTIMSASNSYASGFPQKQMTQTPSVHSSEQTMEVSNAHRMSQVAEVPPAKSRARPAVDINQIFDILPIMGILEPGQSQDITFTYFGMKNQKFDCAAVCQTEGGPEYEVSLKGQASKLDFRLDKTELDFGEVPYTEVQEREVILANSGKVAFHFSWNLCALSRPAVLDCWPMSGQINPGDKEKIIIRFRAGVPDEVSEVALLEVAHFERQRIHVRGHGIFPGVLLMQGATPDVPKSLERCDEDGHATNRELALQRLLTNGPPPQAACVSTASQSLQSAEHDTSADSLAQWQPEPQVVEFEVDRHFICQTLLAIEKEQWPKHLEKHAKEMSQAQQKGSARGSARARADWRPMLELPPVTAAYYCCNFGHIVLGHSGKKVISVYNSFHENVTFNISKRLLNQHGFQISPEKVGKLPPGKQIKLEITCFRDRTGEEGKQETNWIIPVRGGPSYEVKLMSEFVRPDLELSSDAIDFGHVLVGQVKRITMRLRNVKPVVVCWDYKVPEKLGKAVECAYLLQPPSGRIAPGESQLVTVSFTPTASKPFIQKLALRILDNPNRKPLVLRGHGDGLRVTAEPSTSYELGPVLPGTDDCAQEIFLCNPTDYAIEVYSVDFDHAYSEEEQLLQMYDQYEGGKVELPVRGPGAPTWPAVVRHGRHVRRQELLRQRQEKEEQKAAARQEAAERVEAAQQAVAALEGAEDAEAQEKAAAELSEAEAALAEIDATPEEEPLPEEESVEEAEVVQQPEMDPADFPYRVPEEDRLHVLVIGPETKGKLAARLEEQGRKLLALDAVVDWALSGPPSLEGPEEEARRDRLRQLMATQDEEHEKAEKDREKQAQKAKQEYVPQAVQYELPINDVVYFLKVRVQLPDCNACMVFDGLESKYLSPEQSAQALVAALWPERLLVLGFSALRGEPSPVTLGEGHLPKPESPDGDAPEEGGEVPLMEQPSGLVAALEAAVAEVQKKHAEPVEAAVVENAEGTEAAAPEADGAEAAEGLEKEKEGAEEKGDEPQGESAPDPVLERPPFAQFIPISLEASFEEGEECPQLQWVPAPLIPTEPPIPPTSFAQVVEKPHLRLPRASVENFRLITPEEAVDEGAEAARTESKKVPEKDKAPAAPEERMEPTRWLIEPHGRVRLLVKFFSEEIGAYQASLGFEVVGGIHGNAPVSIEVSGTTAFPGISSDPRNVFMRRVKTKPASGYASKQYIASTGIFDFGPLLVGRSPDARKEEGADTHIKQHIECFRITNNSLFKAEAAFSLASAKAQEDPKPGKPGKKEAPSSNLEEFPFLLEPAQLELEVGETKELQVCCFPVKEGSYSDTIVAKITDNPEPVEFAIAAIGSLPKVSLDSTELDFDRLLVKQRAANGVKVSNVSAVPVKWRLEAAGSVPEPFEIDAMEGVLAVGEEKHITVVFRSETACTHKFKMSLQISDTEGLEGLRKWENTEDITVNAEAFAVDVVPSFPSDAQGLDFGDVRVGAVVEQTFQVANNGKYAVSFDLKVRRKVIKEILQIDYGVVLEDGKLPELQPGQKQAIKVTAVTPVAMQCPEPKRFARTGRNEELELLVYDAKTGERVQVDTPLIPLTLRAVYNSFNLNPPRGLSFGPVKIGESGTRELEIYNDGPFKFEWYVFNTAGSMKKPEKELLVGDFKITPAEGSLAPNESVKISGTFTATEPKFCECKIGIHVDGLPDEPRSGISRAEGEGDTGFKEYLLTAQSCTPGIDTENMQSIFEEQFVAPTLEDAIATAGRIDIRAFDEEARYFSFGPVSVQGQSSPDQAQDAAKFRITNPNPIPCDVKFDIKPTTAPSGKDAPVLPFELSTKDLHIPAHEYRYVKVRFAPQALQRYSAMFEAAVPEGKDSKTNLLKFEMRGDGTVPSISINGPTIFGDSGAQYDFGKLRIGKKQTVEFSLYNQGQIPATARCELTPNSHFTVSCPRSIPLEPKATQKFQVVFRPSEPGALSTSLRLHTLHNSFEDTRVTFAGQGYVEDVCWELPEPSEPANPGARSDPDVLNLGEACVGSESVVTFQLSNSANSTLRFHFPETVPAPLAECLRISPSVGHVLPGMKKQITFTYKPLETMKADVSLPVHMASIVQEAGAEDWDNAHMPAEEGEEAKEPEPAHALVEGSEREMPLRTLAVADQMSYECGIENIFFSPTVLFQTRLYRFTVTNPSSIALPFNWRVMPATSDARDASGPARLSAYSISPAKGSIAAGATEEFQLLFAPKEVEDFAGLLDSRMPLQEPLRIPLNASALRPWCHFEVPSSDYRARRQAETSLDPKYQVIEFESLGTRVRNTKRFYVLNPTSDTYEFNWMQEEVERKESEDPFRCLTKRGTILPGKKYEMTFEYLPADTETHESRWVFSVPGKQASQSFVLVGTVKEPRLGLDRPCIKFNRLLLGAQAVEKVCIINKEHLPFSFSFDRSYKTDGQPAISLSPESGVVGPGASFPVEVRFAPTDEKFFNYNVMCNIKRKDKPLLLNIKGEGYKIHTKLVIDEADREGRLLHPGVKELLDFGDLQVQEKRSFTLKLSSPTFERDRAADTEQASVSYDFIWQLRSASGRLMAPQAEAPPHLTITPVHGVATQEAETVITIEYTPTDAHKLDGATLRMLIPSGPDESGYTLALAGRAYRPALDFSTLSHDFGSCFVKRIASAGEPAGVPMERLDLTVTNRGVTDCWLSTTFQRTNYLDVQLPAVMIEAGQSVVVPIVFTPKDYVEYRERIEFVVNDCTKYYVNVRGQGCPLQLEAASLAMQNVDFGVAVGNQGVSRTLRVVNRSVRSVEFSLQDDGQLAEKCVSWTPQTPVKLRPKEQASFELRYVPSFPMPAFKLPLVASCNFGIDVHLGHASGSCHAAEVRLSEHSILFGDVVFGAASTKLVHLHNFGDLGVKFRFDLPPKSQGHFSVEPAEGYAAPRDDVVLQVSFHPQRSNSFDGRPKRLRCLLEPQYQQEPIELLVQGNGIEQPEGSTIPLAFTSEVRERKTQEITFPPSGKNTSSEAWKVNPVISTEIPNSEQYFSCPSQIVVPAGGQATVPVTYRPLTMTRVGDEAEEDASKSKKVTPEKHMGRLFIATPDGNAFVWSLEGTSQPGQDRKLSAEVQCKTPHMQSVPLTNWLQQAQRFRVEISLVQPAQATEEIKLNGIGSFDVPAGQAKDYKFNVYAYREGAATVRVLFTNPKTEEFVAYEISLKFVAPKSIETLHFNTVCRQLASRSISVMNPLTSVAKFKCQATNPDIRFSSPEFSVAPNSEATVDVLFRPVMAGSGEAKVSLSSPELGDFPYTVEHVAKPAGLEKTIVFKAPLGSLDCMQTFRFYHYTQKATTFSAAVEPAPGQKSCSDFVPEAKDVKVDAAGPDGLEVSVNVKFQPSELGEIRALLVLTSADGGEYKALLVGYAQPPQPQGPVDVPKGKPTNVDFQNPFLEPVEFSLQVDNPSFQLAQRAFKLDPKKNVPIPVSFVGDRPLGGRLLVSTSRVSTPWVIFLQGVM
ncbi:unnamed protein product [Effrenium voratum]|nr:unnamed protein product [Effrenium voratum]